MILLLLPTALALYQASSPVKMVTQASFQKDVVNNDGGVMMEFFASWCGHCKQLAPEYEKAAKALKGIATVAAVEDQAVMGQYGVQGFPTLKFFGLDKKKPVDFNGGRDAKSIVDFVLQEVSKMAKERLTGKKGGGSSGGGSGGDKVVVLTSSNFDKKLMQSADVWFVKFYAPWCGHCKQMEPTWKDFADKMAGKVKVGKVDATVEGNLAQRFGVNGYPTLKIFPAGHKSESSVLNYEQGRDLESLTKSAMDHYSQTIEAEQLLNQKQFDEKCASKLCVVAFLPHILDSQASGRKKYLKDYNNALRSSGGVPAEFFWSQGGDQFEFEEKLNLSFGYPALMAISMKKEMYGIHRGAFTQDGIRGFILNLGGRGANLQTLPKELPKLKKSDKWDGKDAKPIEEEL